ncbi:MAG: sugar phosphate isomerase/epimerase [Phycisphaerae bacterium]|nr:sugar phosphate isomerase/epimerase [Phycisphaerae bacterium]
MTEMNRREFLSRSTMAGAAAVAGSAAELHGREASVLAPAAFRFGLVTYLWGQDWDLETLVRNCEKTGYWGVELRTQHKHGVDDHLDKKQRAAVKKRFADTKVELVGLGCNWAFHDKDPARLKANIEGAKRYVKLCHDVGGGGVKVKPNDLPKGVPFEKTVEQIGGSLNEVGKFAADYKCEIRVEVHGRCSELPTMKAIFDHVTEPNVGVCWNCNATDLKGKGLEHNFNLVKARFGRTAHVRELDDKGYPYRQLMNLFRKAGWKGWVLLEARGRPKDRIAALRRQMELFRKMTT